MGFYAFKYGFRHGLADCYGSDALHWDWEIQLCALILRRIARLEDDPVFFLDAIGPPLDEGFLLVRKIALPHLIDLAILDLAMSVTALIRNGLDQFRKMEINAATSGPLREGIPVVNGLIPQGEAGHHQATQLPPPLVFQHDLPVVPIRPGVGLRQYNRLALNQVEKHRQRRVAAQDSTLM